MTDDGILRVSTGYVARKWQREVHLAPQRYKILAVHRRAGKTEVALNELFDSAIRDQRPTATYAYIAPFANQAHRIAWRRLKKLVSPLYKLGLCKIFEQEKAVELHHGPRIQLFGADNPDAIRGFTLMGAVLDEVAQMPPEIWDDVVFAALQDSEGWALFIGTPGGNDLFYKLFHDKRTNPNWFVKSYTVYDTKVFSKEKIEAIVNEIPEETFAREFLCDFTIGGDRQLISLVDVHLAQRRKYKPEDVAGMPKILACDPARFGDDSTAIIKRVGMRAFDIETHQKLDLMEIANRLALIARTFQPDAIFVDEGGLGGGVVDRMRQMGFNVIGVSFGSKAANSSYENIRTEMWMKMRDWIRSGADIPVHKKLEKDLTGPMYSISRRDKWALETKDDLKKRGLESPDAGDALAMTFAYEVNVSAYAHNVPDFSGAFGSEYSWDGSMQKPRSVRLDYNPFSNL